MIMGEVVENAANTRKIRVEKRKNQNVVKQDANAENRENVKRDVENDN